MRELHVVAVSDDGRHVVLASSPEAKKGTFRVPLDARLRAAVQGGLPPRSPARPPAAAGPGLSVREIQARLRAGETAEQIAASAGVALERVERFAGPVWSEQEKMIKAARETPLLHSRRGLSVLPLGEVVDQHFAQIDSLRPDSVSWTARREDSGSWLVEVSYVARARTRSGSWRYDPAARTLVAADSVSASLGHSETTEVGAPAAKRPRGAAPRVPTRGPGKAAAVPSSVSAKATPTSATKATKAAKAAPTSATRSATAATAATKAAPASRSRRRAAAPTPPRAPAAVRTTPGTKAPPVVARPGQKVGAAPSGPPALRVVPALDQQPRQPSGGRATAGRASVPAWADVLLSTSPPAADEQEQGEASSD